MGFKFEPTGPLGDIQNDFPKVTRILVQTSDIDGVSYMSGCEGLVKVEQYKDTDNVVRADVTYTYTDASYPDTWIDIIIDVKEV